MAARPRRRCRAGRRRQGTHPRHPARVGQADVLRRRRAEERALARSQGRGGRLRRDPCADGELSHARDAGAAGRLSAHRFGARRRLGSRADRPRALRARRPEDPLRHARGDARPDPRRDRHHQDGPHAGPDGRAALPARRQAVRAARSARDRLGRRDCRVGRRVARAGAGMDRLASRCRPAVGPQGLPHAGRNPGEPEDRRRARGGAGRAGAEDARPLSGDAGDPGSDGRGRARRLRHGGAHRGEKARQGPGRAERQEHDPGVLLRPAGDPLRQGAPEGLSVVAAGQGRHPRRRHDGRRHRSRQRVARHRLRPEGRLRPRRPPPGSRRSARSPPRRSSAARSTSSARRSCSRSSRRPPKRARSMAAS